MHQNYLEQRLASESESSLEIVYSIADLARQIFVECKAESDFCIQEIGESYIIFGSTNRVKWTAKRGMVPSQHHCTEGFMLRWNEARENAQDFCDVMN